MSGTTGGKAMFVASLVKNGLVSAEQVVKALESQHLRRPHFGKIAMEQGKLTVRQVSEILMDQVADRRLFGQIAIDKGYLTEEDVFRIIGIQKARSQPLEEILLEMGAIDHATLQREYDAYQDPKAANANNPMMPSGSRPK